MQNHLAWEVLLNGQETVQQGKPHHNPMIRLVVLHSVWNLKFYSKFGEVFQFLMEKKKNCDKFYDFIGALSGWKASAHHGKENTQGHIRKVQ